MKISKRALTAVLAGLIALSVIGCNQSASSADNTTDVQESNQTTNAPKQEQPQKEEIPDLTGEWMQSNAESGATYQTATITDTTIEVYWVSDEDDTESLYWAGSFEAPKGNKAYSFDSVNDKEKTGNALLASGDDTKTFKYSDGELSYEVSAFGMTKTVKLKKK